MAKEKYKYEKRIKEIKYSDKDKKKNHGLKTMPFIKNIIKPSSVIDVGCGWNSFCHLLNEKGIESVGVDFACPGADIIADAEYLPFKDGQFDLLTTFDVLEHIPEEEINMVFQEFKRVANKFFYQICLGRGKRHITLKSPTWWLLKIIENQGDIGQITYYDGANNIVPKNKARWITVYGFFNKN